MFLGAAISGRLADRYGRRLIFQATLILFSIGAVLSALAPTFETLLAARVDRRTRARRRAAGRRDARLGVLTARAARPDDRAARIVLGVRNDRRRARRASSCCRSSAGAARSSSRHCPRSTSRICDSRCRSRLAISPSAAATPRPTRSCAVSSAPAAARCSRSVPPSRPRAPARTSIAELWSPAARDAARLMLWILWFGMVLTYYGMFLWIPTLLDRARARRRARWPGQRVLLPLDARAGPRILQRRVARGALGPQADARDVPARHRRGGVPVRHVGHR